MPHADASRLGSRQGGPVQVVDFFSGCGGMSFGFATARTKNLHFSVHGAIDTDPHANATYRRMLGIEPLREDIRAYASEQGVRRLRCEWHLDSSLPLVVLGCAPCQGFSSHRKKDPRTDHRNTLLEALAYIAVRLKPDILIMENVPEMLHRSHWQHYERWRALVSKAGYRVRSQIHNLAQFGVPQERFRALIVAAREWEFFATPQPTLGPDAFRTVRDAISKLPALVAGACDARDPMHITSRHRPETVALLRQIPLDGGSRRSLPRGVGPRCLRQVDGFRDVYGRLAWDRPAVAITARCRTPSCGRYVHPTQHRGLSVREAALLQGFPKNYYFEGPFDDKFKQIGNAVSPIFSRALAEYLDREWLADHSDSSRESDVTRDINQPIEKSFSSSIAALKRRLRTDQSARPIAS